MSDSNDAVISGSEPVFRALADNIPNFVCLANAHGEPFFLNAAGRRLVGIDENAPLATLTLHQLYSDDSWHELRDQGVPTVNRIGHWQGRSRLRNAQSGQLIDVATTMFRVRSQQGDRSSSLAIMHREAVDRARLEEPVHLENPVPIDEPVVVAVSDKTAALQEALAEAQSRKNSILESSLDPIITIDHEGVIIEFNRAAEHAFLQPRDKVLGKRPSEVLFPPSLSAEHSTRIQRYLEAGEGSMLGKRTEVVAARSNGETFAAEMAMTIGQVNGAPVLTFFVRDISQRKKSEEEQARYAAELERSNRDLEQFAYVASHDLQEPLRKIRAFGDRLEMKCKDLLDETASECITRMQSAAARMQELIEGILTLSRITTRACEYEQVDLALVAQQVVGDLEAQLERVDGRVDIGKMPTIQAEPLQIRLLLQNLIGNALKFHRADEPPVVNIEARYVGSERRKPGRSYEDEKCLITVVDNGIGFEEQYKDKIFGIFQRLHPRDVYEGTGIGLAICRRIVEFHGGQITARSVLGRGSTFEVLLPVAQQAKKPQQTKKS